MQLIQPKPQTQNPANLPDKVKVERDRIPMSLPLQKLAVPDVPGYHLHWMAGTQQRLAQAMRAGYTFVEQDEVDLNRVGLADSAEEQGSTDLGSRVSVVSGQSETGGVQRMFLMKIPQDLWEKDQSVLGDRQEQIAAQLRGDKGYSQAGGDATNRYSKREQANLFIPKSRRT